MRRQLAVRAFHGEVLLMIAHHGHEDFFGKREVLLLKAAEQHRRPLGEIRNRVDEALILAPARAGNRSRRRIQRLADLVPARLGDPLLPSPQRASLT